jgi:hypothetical protein
VEFVNKVPPCPPPRPPIPVFPTSFLVLWNRSNDACDVMPCFPFLLPNHPQSPF